MEANRQIAALLATSDPVTIGKWTFHADSLLLECSDNSVKLEPRVAYLLYYLAENAGAPVSRAELTDRVWSGMVVSDEALTGAVNKLRNAFGDDSHHPTVIKTIPKVGYQLVADVQFPSSTSDKDQSEAAANNKFAFAAYVLIGLLVVAGALFIIQRTGTTETPPILESPEKPSIAVLPFINMGADPSQQYFADGITEDLITDLSKISALFVISRNSVFFYKGTKVNIQQVAEELGVRYILEGSVRKAGNQVRVNTQLTDATTAGHIWAERYDGTYEDVFALQDRITRKIVATLAIKLTEGEQNQITQEETSNPAAYDTFLKGWEQYLRQTPESFRQAITFFERAVELDPGYTRAYAALSLTYWQGWKSYWHSKLGYISPHELRFEAEKYLAKAMKEPTSLALQISTSMLAQQGRHDKAIAEGERAISVDPNNPDSYVALAGALNLAGYPEESLPLMEKALRLNPHYPTSYLHELGLARFGMQEYDAAEVALQRAVTLNPTDRWSSRLLIATLGYLDRADEAVAIIDRIKESWRGFDPLSVHSIAFWYPFKDTVDAERLAEGLRKAGLPD